MQRKEITIRQARPVDANKLMRLIRELAKLGGVSSRISTSTSELNHAMSGDQSRFAAFIVESGNKAIGYATYTVAYSIWTDQCYINVDDIFVKPACRGLGAGRMLISAIALLCDEQNCCARWEQPRGNDEGISFYKGIGVAMADKRICHWDKHAIRAYLESQTEEEMVD